MEPINASACDGYIIPLTAEDKDLPLRIHFLTSKIVNRICNVGEVHDPFAPKGDKKTDGMYNAEPDNEEKEEFEDNAKPDNSDHSDGGE